MCATPSRAAGLGGRRLLLCRTVVVVGWYAGLFWCCVSCCMSLVFCTAYTLRCLAEASVPDIGAACSHRPGLVLQPVAPGFWAWFQCLAWWPGSPAACVYMQVLHRLCFVIQPAILILQLSFSSCPCPNTRGMHCWARLRSLFRSRLPPDPAAACLCCTWALCTLAPPCQLVGCCCTCIQGAVPSASY